MLNRKRQAQSICLGTAVWVLSTVPGVAAGESLTQESSIKILRRELQLAVCLNYWDQAVDLVGGFIASPEISPGRRAELVQTRQQLQQALQRQAEIDITAFNCEERLTQFVPTYPVVSPPLALDKALFYSTVATNDFEPIPDRLARRQLAAQQAGLTQGMAIEIPALSSARVVPTHTGMGVSAGSVSTGVDVFSFIGGRGDQISLSLAVTEVLPGRLYSDDDSQIFLFDQAGTLLAENDDLSRLQSEITGFTLPRADIYYVAVTTYNNDPILDSSQRITGWSGNGGSAIEYTITITGLTPAGQLILPPVSSPES